MKKELHYKYSQGEEAFEQWWKDRIIPWDDEAKRLIRLGWMSAVENFKLWIYTIEAEKSES